MSSAPTPVKGATAALTVAFVAAAFWVLRGYVWPTLSNVEVGPLQASLDPTLFRNDFTVQESLRFSPRFYYNQLILLPARAGVPLAWCFAAWHVLALGAFVAAVYSVAATLRLGIVALAALLVWLLSLTPGTIGSVLLYHHAPVPAVWAGALALCGAAYAVRKRYVGAFACFGGAALLQFLVGFYAGVLALPVLLATESRQRWRALGAWGLGLALVYVPLWISGRGDALALGNDAFVEIYAQVRHPHHLVPSTWPWFLWSRLILFYMGSWYFLRATSAGRPAFERTLLHSTLFLTAAALALNYVFVEVWPSAFVAKLQPARITPLAQAIVLTLIATRVQRAFDAGRRVFGVLIALAPMTLFPGLVLALAGILGRSEEGKTPPVWPMIALAASVVLAFGFGGTFLHQVWRHGAWLSLFVVPLVAHGLRARRAVLTTATCVVMGLAGYTAHASTLPSWPAFLAGRFTADAPPGDPPGILGRRFRDHSSKDVIVLVPPSGETWTFKLYAQRAVVVDDKNIPFTLAGLKEWHDRMQQVLGVPFTRGTDGVVAWRAQTPAALQRLAARYGAHHILTRDEWHPAFAGKKIDTEQGWSLWEIAAEK